VSRSPNEVEARDAAAADQAPPAHEAARVEDQVAPVARHVREEELRRQDRPPRRLRSPAHEGPYDRGLRWEQVQGWAADNVASVAASCDRRDSRADGGLEHRLRDRPGAARAQGRRTHCRVHSERRGRLREEASERARQGRALSAGDERRPLRRALPRLEKPTFSNTGPRESPSCRIDRAAQKSTRSSAARSVARRARAARTRPAGRAADGAVGGMARPQHPGPRVDARWFGSTQPTTLCDRQDSV